MTRCHRQYALLWGAAALALLLAACKSETEVNERALSAYRERMLAQHAQPATNPPQDTDKPSKPVVRPAGSQPGLPTREALLTQPNVTSRPSPEQVLRQIPDPADAIAEWERRLQDFQGLDPRIVRTYERVLAVAKNYLVMVDLPVKARLALVECVERALQNNYAIRIESYNPAISTAALVEAEAAFDAEFFLDTSYIDRDPAVIPRTTGSQSNSRSYGGGFRQLLPTGMQVSTTLRQVRNYTSLDQKPSGNSPIAVWNPAYSTAFVADFRQPLLRGFGLDVNRAQINIRVAERDIANDAFLIQVRNTLLQVEEAYWRLAQTRRNVSIQSETTAQNLVTYQNMVDRRAHDATEVELRNSESRWKQRYVALLESVKLVRDAEDQLKNLLNDPALKLSDKIEIVTTEAPFMAPLAIDQFAEVRTAIDQRGEIRQARRRIDETRINTMVAKNATLPQLDLSFAYEVSGLGQSADSSFDNLTTARYQSYTVSATFSYPIGNRAPEARLRQARLRESQSLVALYQTTDEVVRQVNDAVRGLVVRYEQIPPQLEATVAASLNLRALQARTQRIDPAFLQTELDGVENLASTRTTLLRVLTDYNLSIVELEAAKGTLLEYNNVVPVDLVGGR